MNGSGVKIEVDGSMITGDFHHGKVHGFATKKFSCGDTYSGNYDSDVRNGFGRYSWTSDTISTYYEGEWKCDEMSGQGERVICSPLSAIDRLHLQEIGLPDSVLIYRGGFRKGVRHGKGIGIMSDGVKYTGDWVDDMPNGYGRFDYPIGAYYNGDVVRGKRQGLGILVVSNSSGIEKHARYLDGCIELDKSTVDSLLRFEQHEHSAIPHLQISGLHLDQIDFTENSFNVEDVLEACRDFSPLPPHHQSATLHEGTVSSSEGEALNEHPAANMYRGHWLNDMVHGEGVVELCNGQVRLADVRDKPLCKVVG